MSLRLPTSQPSDKLGSQPSALKFNGAPGSPSFSQLCPLAPLSFPTRGLESLRCLLELIWVRRWRGASCLGQGKVESIGSALTGQQKSQEAWNGETG